MWKRATGAAVNDLYAATLTAGGSANRCCQILRERREDIVQRMTEGRLNHLLDVLRSRRALGREECELITAALTLAARTRSLLDTCLCLGEHVAVLVVSTLGLGSASNAPSPSHVTHWKGTASPRVPSDAGNLLGSVGVYVPIAEILQGLLLLIYSHCVYLLDHTYTE